MLLRSTPDHPALAVEPTPRQADSAAASPVCRTLASLRPGEAGRLCRVETGNGTQERLADLGFVRGTRVRIVRAAPLGDPLEIQLRGTRLCLRKAEARSIWVHPADAAP